MENLSKTLPIVQAQFDSLLEFCAEPKDLNNGVIMAAFRLLYKDLVKLYVAYQEAIINLLERYFKLSRKKTREALEMYKNYLARMDKVAGFLRVVEAVELDKSEMPDLTNSPASILKLLEQHLAQLEAKKRGTTPIEQPEDENSAATETKNSQDASRKTEDDEKKPSPAASPDVQATQANVSIKSDQENKQTAPQKPARPSPKASPSASPLVSQPVEPPKQSTQASPASKQPPAHPAPPEKKGPPERPAKPPSRPPPPAATGSGCASSTSTATTPNRADPTQVAAEVQPKAPKAAHSATSPPPHPPPPVHHHAPSSPAPPTASTKSSSPASDVPHEAAAQEATPTPETPNNLETQEAVDSASTNTEISPPNPEASTLDDMNDNEQAAESDAAPAPSCSSVANRDGSVQEVIPDTNGQVNSASGSANENHMNNVGQEDMPEPPPPIDEEGNEEVAGVNLAHQDLPPEERPVANGAENVSDHE